MLAEAINECYDNRMKKLRLTAFTMAASLLASCSVFSQKEVEDVPTAEHTKTTVKTKTDKTATSVQKTSVSSLLEEAPTTGTIEETYEEPQTYSSSTSAIPGRSGLRMGNFAPPEEATSIGSNEPPRPNAAEQKGLRSPQLPGSLPLDVNGQTKKN